MKRSFRQLLVGLKDQDLRLADVWCDLDDVWTLSEAGLIKLDTVRKTLSLTDEGRAAIGENAASAPPARQPGRNHRERLQGLASRSHDPATSVRRTCVD